MAAHYNARMLVFDLDGTLLRGDKCISHRTVAVLTQCRALGIKAAYATARGNSASQLVPTALFDGRITMNGAIAYDGMTNVYNRLIPYAVARPLMLACDAHGLKTASECGGMHYVNFPHSDAWPHSTHYAIVNFTQHEIDAEMLCMKLEHPENIGFIAAHLPESLRMTVLREGYAMVMHKEATKSLAMLTLARRWQIDRQHIVAFGDDMNDLDMLDSAGIGVAMGNALPDIKSHASYVCGDNDADGVALWISEHILP